MINQRENHTMAERDESYVETLPRAGIMPESLIQVIWQGRWIVLLATVAALAAGFIYLEKTTPIYTSTSRIYVEKSGPKIISDTEAGGIMTGSKNYLYTQAELLRSTPILAAVLEAPGMRQLETFSNVDNPIAYLKHNLVTDVGKKDDIINVSFNSPYPAEAAKLVNQVVDSYITYHATRKRSTAAEVLKILQSEKLKRDKQLAEKREAIMDFKLANDALAFESNRGNKHYYRTVCKAI